MNIVPKGLRNNNKSSGDINNNKRSEGGIKSEKFLSLKFYHTRYFVFFVGSCLRYAWERKVKDHHNIPNTIDATSVSVSDQRFSISFLFHNAPLRLS